MGKGWSIFFGVVLLGTFLLCVAAPFVNGWWLPPNVASFGGEIDYLFYLILGFTAFFFVLTEVILVYSMWRNAYRPGHKAEAVYGNHRLEIAWTIVPAAILLFIAFTQVQAWVNIKFVTRMPESNQVVQVMGRQWEWTIRYPRDIVPKNERGWAETSSIDDFYLPEELHTWKGANVKIYLKTQDVLHSFFMPNLRLKQDAVPGRTIPMWFQATDFNARFNPKTGRTDLIDPQNKDWEIACAELCGSGHYRMRGRVYIHEDEADYRRWLEYEIKEANRHTLPRDENENRGVQ